MDVTEANKASCYSTAGLKDMFGLSHAMFRHTEDVSLSAGSLGHPSEGLQVPAELVSVLFGCKKLLLTPLDQSLLQHLHTCSLELFDLSGSREDASHMVTPAVRDRDVT